MTARRVRAGTLVPLRQAGPLTVVVALVLFLRALVPSGYMPTAAGATQGWAGFTICHGTGDNPSPGGDAPAGHPGDACPFGLINRIAVVFAPPVLPPVPPVATQPPVFAPRLEPFASRRVPATHWARAPPSRTENPAHILI